MTENKALAGKVALVTGAGRNIGRAIALTLADAGAAIVVNARQSRDEADATVAAIDRRGGRAMTALADVSNPDQVGRMVEAAHKQFGRLDILVNNAAVRREAPIDQIDLQEWREIMGIVLDGAFICVKACLPHLRRGGTGAIVNIGGLTGHTGSKNRPHVVAAKAGLVGLTKALAHDLARDGIMVNCVVPGLIETVRKASSSVNPGHHALHYTLTGGRGAPQDIADAVLYLVNSRYVTGQTLHVNGGAYLG
ncbi:MAG TPA: SDR family oxidoreductase [Alphaproteobacteria bacterium]|nr:SDR family oxidoreductase [Alphaproteobacteria bacterium]